jgi:hypothetical protein
LEDFGLIIFGDIANAEITRVESHSVRLGRRGRGIKHTAEYKFVAEDGKTYRGSGDYEGLGPPMVGGSMPIRYMTSDPSLNAPKDELIGPGILLTLAGGFIAFIVIGHWRRKPAADRARNQDKRRRSSAS